MRAVRGHAPGRTWLHRSELGPGSACLKAARDAPRLLFTVNRHCYAAREGRQGRAQITLHCQQTLSRCIAPCSAHGAESQKIQGVPSASNAAEHHEMCVQRRTGL